MGRKYKKVVAGEWQRPVRNGYKMACCDCGLVHIIDFRLVQGKHIELRAFRNNRSTALLRRYKGVNIKHPEV